MSRTDDAPSTTTAPWVCASEDAAVAVRPWGNVLVAHWTGPVTLDNLRHYNRALALVAALTGGKLAILHVLDSGAQVPGHDERMALLESFAIHRSRVSCVAVLARGSQFWAGTWPSWLLASRMLSTHHTPVEAFSAPERALRWVAANHQRAAGCAIDEQALAEWLVLQLRASERPRQRSSQSPRPAPARPFHLRGSQSHR
jgi:hypothetical protein